MITSLWQIDFITATGTRRLLSPGEIIESDISPKVAQSSSTYAPIGAEWGETQADGNALVDFSWSVIRNHASHAALRNHCMLAAATFPSGETGTLRLTITGGDTWDIYDATVMSLEPLPKVPSHAFETLTPYAARGGQMLPAAPIALYPGIPWDFLLQDWDDLTTLWDNF